MYVERGEAGAGKGTTEQDSTEKRNPLFNDPLIRKAELFLLGFFS